MIKRRHRTARTVRRKTRRVAARRRTTGHMLPTYDQLPVRPGAPQGAAWGVFGERDELGTINHLTPERVLHHGDFNYCTGLARSLRP